MRVHRAPALDGEALWPLAQEQAKERQGERTDLSEHCENFTQGSTGKTRDQIGAAVEWSGDVPPPTASGSYPEVWSTGNARYRLFARDTSLRNPFRFALRMA